MPSVQQKKELKFSVASFNSYVEQYLRAQGFIHDDMDIRITDIIVGTENVHVTLTETKEGRMQSISLNAKKEAQKS